MAMCGRVGGACLDSAVLLTPWTWGGFVGKRRTQNWDTLGGILPPVAIEQKPCRNVSVLDFPGK